MDQALTEKEKKDNFYLELISLEDLKEKIKDISYENPRTIYFLKELEIVLTKQQIKNPQKSRTK